LLINREFISETDFYFLKRIIQSRAYPERDQPVSGDHGEQKKLTKKKIFFFFAEWKDFSTPYAHCKDCPQGDSRSSSLAQCPVKRGIQAIFSRAGSLKKLALLNKGSQPQSSLAYGREGLDCQLRG